MSDPVSRRELVRRAIAAVNERPEGTRAFFGDIEDAGPDFFLELEQLELIGDRALFADRDQCLEAVRI